VMSTTTGPDQYLLDGGLMGMSIFGQTVHSEAEAEAVVLARMAELEGRELDETEKTAVRNLAHTFYQSNQPLRTLSMRSAEYSAINGGPSGGDGSVTQPFVWSLDMSEFFGDVKPMQILTWVRYRS
jgi:hypothetical protein